MGRDGDRCFSTGLFCRRALTFIVVSKAVLADGKPEFDLSRLCHTIPGKKCKLTSQVELLTEGYLPPPHSKRTPYPNTIFGRSSAPPSLHLTSLVSLTAPIQFCLPFLPYLLRTSLAREPPPVVCGQIPATERTAPHRPAPPRTAVQQWPS
ncbi:hypothetical protein PoB_007672900 [Plakobranchus ocellatus]|uniref:Uncharacterized protein n=1 Tax=Plakobranchus ocellatus TaxID=259542 RepID=A0AAV4E1Q5_9GAST|nr:hypothetical protein PoB_007672900 [Plakobranchus ocellatus]